jgi:hypothetical protein
LNRYTIDLAKGGMLQSYEGEVRDDKSRVASRESWTWKLSKVAGIWLPDEVTYEKADYQDSPSGRGRFRGPLASSAIRGLKWKESRVNERVDPSDFSLASLGMKPGDVISDTTTDVMYEYGKEAPVKAASWPIRRYLLIVINVAVVAVLITLIWRRRGAHA